MSFIATAVRSLLPDHPLEYCKVCQLRGNGNVYPLPEDLRIGHQRLKCPKCGVSASTDHNLASAIRGWNKMQNGKRDGQREFEVNK